MNEDNQPQPEPQSVQEPQPVQEPEQKPEPLPVESKNNDFDINDILSEIEKEAQSQERTILDRAADELKKEVYTKDQMKMVMKELIKKNRDDLVKQQSDFDRKLTSQIEDFRKQLSELDNKTSNRVSTVPTSNNPYREKPKPKARDLFDLQDLSTEERMEIFRQSTGIQLR